LRVRRPFSTVVRVLIADDDPAMVDLLQVRLRRWGYETTVARDGEAALVALEADRDLRIVISDWMMPGIEGVELCRRIREMEGRAYTYVILVTAKAQSEDLVQAFAAGADEFLSKPFQPRELQMRLEAAKRLLVQMSRGRPSHGPAIAPHPGMVVGDRYRLTALLGAGGMGTVWEAEHVVLGSKVAIKFLRCERAESPDVRARFEAEARIAARLASPFTVRVFDYGVGDGGAPYLVMEHFRGRTLADAVAETGPLRPETLAKVIRQVATALARAHAAGVIHRDVKPENIFLAEDELAPGEITAKLIDFGVAKETGAAPGSAPRNPAPMTKAGEMVGTPHFISPEYFGTAKPDFNLDLWGLAATAYYALVGEAPFDGDSFLSVVRSVCHAPLPVPSRQSPAIPSGFDAWFARACARDPAARFATPAELASSLEEVCRDAAVRKQGPDDSTTGGPRPGASARPSIARRTSAALSAIATMLQPMARAVLFV
jgi:serine/threonine-protein kinase